MLKTSSEEAVSQTRRYCRDELRVQQRQTQAVKTKEIREQQEEEESRNVLR